MKSNIFKSMVVAVVAIIAGYNVYQSNVNSQKLSDVMLENVEAIAQNENGNGGNYEYPDGYPYSVTCNVKISDGTFFNEYCSVIVITCQAGGSGCNSKKCPIHRV